MYPLRYLPSGHIFMDSGDDCDRVVDAILSTGYNEDFCLAGDFEEDFIRRLMEAGFLVMSMELDEKFFILLPKLHLLRSVLFFPKLHIRKRVRPLLSRYELRTDTNFQPVLDKCLSIHGEDWLTPPFVEILKSLRRNAIPEQERRRARPFSFELYRDGELKAGEFGIVMGKVYTSYSGYYEENDAGTVQMILMAQWLENAGFDFLDFGMPLDYKNDLGAENIDACRFVEIFRAAQT